MILGGCGQAYPKRLLKVSGAHSVASCFTWLQTVRRGKYLDQFFSKVWSDMPTFAQSHIKSSAREF